MAATASLYSYYAMTWLRRNRKLLEQYNVDIDINPVFLGGINVGSGNKPPWTLPAKAKYGSYDARRAMKYFQAPELTTPPFFPILSVLPQRAMIAVKDRQPREAFEKCFLTTWEYSFITHVDISKPEGLAKLLSEHFDEAEVKEIMRLGTTKEYKDRLTANTQRALDRGAFGAPWFWMTNDKGISEPLFGSDRWPYMLDFLGVEFRDIEIVDRAQRKVNSKL